MLYSNYHQSIRNLTNLPTAEVARGLFLINCLTGLIASWCRGLDWAVIATRWSALKAAAGGWEVNSMGCNSPCWICYRHVCICETAGIRRISQHPSKVDTLRAQLNFVDHCQTGNIHQQLSQDTWTNGFEIKVGRIFTPKLTIHKITSCILMDTLTLWTIYLYLQNKKLYLLSYFFY